MRKHLLSALLTLSLMACTGWAALAQRVVSGRVLSGEDNSGIPGVNVVVKGTTTGTATNVDGDYTLTVPDDPALVLTFSSIGFVRQEVTLGQPSALGGPTVFNITLAPDVKVLQEAVVIGYGSVNKKDVTGSVVSVGRKDFQNGFISTPDQLLAGKVAGVNIVSNGGAPGGGSTIRIRGGSSLSASNDPLIVIDGVPVDNTTTAFAPSILSTINPNDIENITVLKDASATAIYGSRASNGVLLITTRRGAVNSKPAFNFSTQNSISVNVRKLKVLSGEQFRQYVQDSLPARASQLGTANTDWQDQIFQDAISSDNNLSVTGGFKTIPYRLSLGYLDQRGTIRTGRIQRESAALTLNPSLFTGHLKANLTLRGTTTQARYAGDENGQASLVGAAASFDPTQPVRSGSDRFGGYFEFVNPGTGTPNANASRNPVGFIEQTHNTGTANRSIGNINLNYAIHGFEDLKLNANLGYDVSEGRGHIRVGDSAASNYLPGGIGGRYTTTKQLNHNYLTEYFVNYTKEVPTLKSRFDVVAGYSYQDFKITNYNYRGLNAAGDTIPATQRPVFASAPAGYRLESFYGRINYSFKDRWLLTGTLREDGSSRFARERRYGLFPSAALAYRLVDEPFMQKVAFVSDFKLRAGYGLTGQQDLGNLGYYPYQGSYSISTRTAQYQLGDQFYQLYQPAAVDPNIHWESTETYNAGVDFGFLKNRITGTVDVYYRQTYDLLGTKFVARGTTFADNLTTNVGNLTNKGIEVAINTVPVQTSKVVWNLGFNVTANRNRITRLSNANPDTVFIPTGGISGGVNSTIQAQAVGQPINSFLVFQQKYDDAGNPIEGQFIDRNGDGKITEKDRYYNHSPAPKLFYGVNTSLQVYKFTLTAVLRGTFGNYVYNNVASNLGTKRIISAQSSYLNNSHQSLFDYRFTGAKNSTQQIQSDLYVQKADFLRLDNISLSYNFGNLIRDNLGLRVNFNVQNLYVITKYKGIDPEISGGIDNNFYPRPRIYVVGLNLDFK